MPRAISINSPPLSVPGTMPDPVAGTEPLVRRVLRVPLLAKLIGANVVMLALAIGAVFYARSIGAGADSCNLILAVALVAGTGINALLTHTALRPIRNIESTITKMLRGDTNSRVTRSAVGDPELDRVGLTLNSLLDRLEQDRDAMQQLAANVVIAEDREHRRIAGALHESVAQSLASITYMLTALAAKSTDVATAERILEIRRVVGDVLDEVDVLSHTIHPRILSDLGIAAGLRSLAFALSTADVPVSMRMQGVTEDRLREFGPEAASALFRIAQEALQNALRHSAASHVDILLESRDDNLILRVTDNGHGFSMEEAERRRPRKGLFLMRQRARLINATLQVESVAGGGTAIEVAMPMSATSLPR